MDFQSYRSLDATAMLRGIQRRDFTPAELLSAAAARMQQVNPTVNAVVQDLTASARGQVARGLPAGPLHGVPFVVKDMDGTLAGHPCTMGSRALANWIPDHDSALIARYRAAGAVFVAKTNCPEFGLVGITEPHLHGPARNPWDLERTPGGSSGGTAAAVAAGIVPVGHGGDGGGSIRIPASHCGLFGLKPSRGRMPMGPDYGEGWHGLAVPHVISRSVRDSALFLDVGRGVDVGAPYWEPPGPESFVAALDKPLPRLRIAFSRKSQLTTGVHPDNVAAVDDAVQLLLDLGHTVDEFDLQFDRKAALSAYLTISVVGAAYEVAATETKTSRKPRPQDFEPATWFAYQLGRVLTAADLEAALAVRDELTRTLSAQLAGYDCHLSATTAVPPVKVGELDLGVAERTGLAALRRISSVTGPATNPVYRTLLAQLSEQLMAPNPNTQNANLSGRPAMSVPLWWNAAGHPIGVQFSAQLGAEELLLRLARELEEARPWFDRVPPL